MTSSFNCFQTDVCVTFRFNCLVVAVVLRQRLSIDHLTGPRRNKKRGPAPALKLNIYSIEFEPPLDLDDISHLII